MLTLLFPIALAESASTLPAGGAALYAGVGGTTYEQLRVEADPTRTSTLDRTVAARLDLYGVAGLTDRVMLAASIQAVYAAALDDDARGPCPALPCDPLATVGAVGAEARVQVARGPVDVTPALAVRSSSWNAGTRGSYVTVGEATTDVRPAVYVGDRIEDDGRALSWVLTGGYTWRTTLYRATDGAPKDDVRASAEVAGTLGRFTLTLGGGTLQRLGGVAVGADASSEDRWAQLDYDNATAGAKISIALADDIGLHVGATRVVWVRNGPPDAVDATVGVHRWFAPRRAREGGPR